jgi:two-component system chemotaxis sensor kinase CheA
MPIDINQFLPTFIEESMEMLQEAEQILVNITILSQNQEDIHRIFRIMHSIKGNSAIFHFTALNELTHSLETFLNNIRSNKQKLSEQDVEMILKAVDCIRTMITSISNKSQLDETKAAELNKIFTNKINTPPLTQAEVPKETNPSKSAIVLLGWDIIFQPDKNILQNACEPTRLFSVLNELGELEIHADTSKLPKFSNLDPAECYITWNLKLYGNISKTQIEDVFAWILHPENVTINPIFLEEKQEIADNNPQTTEPNIHSSITQTTSIRITTEKIDSLINMIGELVITQSVLNQIVSNFSINSLDSLSEALQQLEQNSREIQSSVLRIRMVPIEFVFNRFPRMVHDMAKKMGKQIKLVISGEQTELDKNMLDNLTNPLLHLIRNAIDHGIEEPEIRKSKGKSDIGTIQLNAYQEGSNIIIEVTDDGAGLNKEAILKKAIKLGMVRETDEITTDKIHQFIFQPGFSTLDTVSDVSGRGVGLDVVAKNINEIKGEIAIETSANTGTTIILKIPLTLAIMDCQLVKICEKTYVIPLTHISEIVKIDPNQIKCVDQDTILYYFRNNYIAIEKLQKILSLSNDFSEKIDNKFVVFVDINNQTVGFIVDELLTQQQVVIKNLEENYRKIPGISGVTILGDGSIALIIDVKTIIDMLLHPEKKPENITLKENINLQQIEKSTTVMQQDHDKRFQFLTFSMSEKEFGVDISEVKEIRIMENITSLPNTPDYLKGAINVRGSIIPIIDLCEYLSLKQFPYDLQTVIITLNIKFKNHNHCIGTIVEKVLDTYTVTKDQIKPLPEQISSTLKNYINGLITVNGKMIMLLDTKNLVELVNEQEIAL